MTTIYLLLAFALTIFAKNYVGEPLQCWVPNQWKDPWEGFAESYCFVENTYFVPMNNTALPEVNKREDMEMIYYQVFIYLWEFGEEVGTRGPTVAGREDRNFGGIHQGQISKNEINAPSNLPPFQWVPFILSVMAFFFYLPRGIWRGLSTYSGLALSDMMTAARVSQKKMDEKKGKQLMFLAQTLEHKAEYVGSGALRYGKSLFNLYIVMKILVWLNLMLQFYFLNHFLGTGYVLWGMGILFDLINGRHWQESGHFPRVRCPPLLTVIILGGLL